MAKRREITQEQYEKIAYLARRLVSKKIIAAKLGFSESGFYKRLKKDAILREVLEGNFDEGVIGLYVAQYEAAMNHYQTICKDCSKISEGGFFESCPYCDKLDPLEAGNHNNVRHKFIQADTGMLIHLGKHILGQTDKSLLVVKTNNNHSDDSRYKNLSEAEIDKKLMTLAHLLNEEYGDKKEPGHDELLVDVKKCV